MTQELRTAIDATPVADEPTTAMSWNGVWPGTVVSTSDETKRGLVRVRIPQIHGEPSAEDEFIEDDALPWARPAFPAHELHAAYAIGDGVWVAFWGGDTIYPVILGQFLGSGDAPDAFTSSYVPDPRTRHVRTNNGHEFEMRWVPSEEKVSLRSAAGSEITIYDSTAEQGPRVLAGTPAGRVVEVSDFGGGTARIQTPTQSVIIDDAGQTVTITTPGTVSVNGNTINETSVISNKTYSGAAIWTAALSVLLTAGTLLTITATGALALTGATITLVSAAAVNIGVIGAYRRLLDERFATLYDGHVHPDPVSGNTGPPTALATPTIASYATTNLRGN